MIRFFKIKWAELTARCAHCGKRLWFSKWKQGLTIQTWFMSSACVHTRTRYKVTHAHVEPIDNSSYSYRIRRI